MPRHRILHNDKMLWKKLRKKKEIVGQASWFFDRNSGRHTIILLNLYIHVYFFWSELFKNFSTIYFFSSCRISLIHIYHLPLTNISFSSLDDSGILSKFFKNPLPSAPMTKFRPEKLLSTQKMGGCIILLFLTFPLGILSVEQTSSEFYKNSK